jgi:hypothetical protein
LDMPKNLMASGPVMRPSPSAAPSIRPHRIQASNSGRGDRGSKGTEQRAGGESDLSSRARTTPGRSSGAPWSSCSRGSARSPWSGRRSVGRRARHLRFTAGGSKTLRRGRTVETEQREDDAGGGG